MPSLTEIENALLESRQGVRLGLTDLSDGPGIYGIYGDEEAWSSLGFGEQTNNGLLYLGSTLDGLNRRVLLTHFANRKSPWSIVRRSLASLLRDELGLEIDPGSPDIHRHFGLVRKSDGALSKWMRNRLQVGFWASDDLVELQLVEQEALAVWKPGLCPYAAPVEQRERIEAARQAMSPSTFVRTDVVAPDASPDSDAGSPGSALALLDRLIGGDPIQSLGQGKPTWVTDVSQDKIWLETESSRAKGVGPKSMPTQQFVDAHDALLSSGALTRSDLEGTALRRSAFVLGALALLDGVEVELSPIRLMMALGPADSEA